MSQLLIVLFCNIVRIQCLHAFFDRYNDLGNLYTKYKCIFGKFARYIFFLPESFLFTIQLGMGVISLSTLYCCVFFETNTCPGEFPNTLGNITSVLQPLLFENFTYNSNISAIWEKHVSSTNWGFSNEGQTHLPWLSTFIDYIIYWSSMLHHVVIGSHLQDPHFYVQPVLAYATYVAIVFYIRIKSLLSSYGDVTWYHRLPITLWVWWTVRCFLSVFSVLQNNTHHELLYWCIASEISTWVVLWLWIRYTVTTSFTKKQYIRDVLWIAFGFSGHCDMSTMNTVNTTQDLFVSANRQQQQQESESNGTTATAMDALPRPPPFKLRCRKTRTQIQSSETHQVTIQQSLLDSNNNTLAMDVATTTTIVGVDVEQQEQQEEYTSNEEDMNTSSSSESESESSVATTERCLKL